jgi:glycosyltransferase involved in cell wall biosynthesis
MLGRLGRFMYRGLDGLIGPFAPDIVHAEEEPFSMACWQAFRVARAGGVPFSFYTWENLRRRYPFPQNLTLPRVVRGSAGAMAGNAEAQRIVRNWGFRGPLAVVPQYGVDPREFRPRPAGTCRRALGLPVPVLMAGYAGRLVPEKGVETLVKAVSMLPPRVHALVVGSGPGEAAIRAAARPLGGRAHFIRALPRSRMPLALGAMDCLVLPSRTTREWKEQFGRVVVEAQSCGRWAVGSRSGEIPNVVGDRRLTFREGSARELAGKLGRLLLGVPPAGLKSRLAERARREFSEAAVAGAVDRLLRRVLAS